MRRSSLYGHCVEILDNIRASHQPADNLVQAFFRSRHYLGSKDRRFITESVFDIIRNFRLLDFLARETFMRLQVQRPIAHLPSIVHCATYLRVCMRQDPDGVISDLGGIWRMSVVDVECSAFVEEVDRTQIPAEIQADPVRRIVLEQSFPDSIVQEWVRRYGVEETELLCRASNSPAPTTVRANTLKCSREECRQALHSEDVASELTRLSPFGLILEKRVNTRTLKTFRNGWFELQDEGSQLLALLTGAGPGSFVVDACAGGGGKTLHLASLMENRGKILAFDIDQRRLSRLDERCHRAGVTIVDAILSPPGGAGVAAVGATADAVLIDAPCSGTGTFRRNPGAKLTYDENTVVSMTKSQRQLLEVFSGLVRPGGRLVYATCSLLHAENEAAVEQFLAGAPGFSLLSARDVLSAWGVILPDPSPYLHLHPHRTATDGFFAAVMVRNVG